MLQSLKVTAWFLALAAVVPRKVHSQYIRRSELPASRDLLIGQEFFRSKDPAVLGALNLTAGMNNPLKGLIGGARWATPPLINTVPLRMEWYNLGLDEVMVGEDKFDWKILDGLLEGSASRNMHVVFSVFIHWPGQPLRLPPHLKDVKLYDTDRGKSPNYSDPRIVKALEQYITALGGRYDGDKRIGAIHVGLLGFWGEGHTFPTKGLVSDEVGADVATWYKRAFNVTQIQARYPGPNAAELGLYDGGLFFATLDGAANGGVSKSWYMWPKIVQAGQQDAWKKHMIAGETAPKIAPELFSNSYPAGTFNHQDIKLTIDTLHLSWILHHGAFSSGGYTGDMLQNARKWHAYLGYAFQVTEVAAAVSASGVDMDVTVKQVGVAPFYYDLDLVLACEGLPVPLKQGGVNELIEQGQSKTFSFKGIPVTPECLRQVSITLDSSYAYRSQPVLFAQGTSGTVTLRLLLPTTIAPTASPIRSPTAVPTRAPMVAPTPSPKRLPTAAPVPPPTTVSAPVVAPLASPLSAPAGAPVVVPTLAPMRLPTSAPVAPPMAVPAQVPSAPFVLMPVSVPDMTAFFVDADPTSGPRFLLTSSTTYSSISSSMAGTAGYNGNLFRQHRWRSGGFTYSISGFTPASSQAVTLGFAETYQPNCGAGKRVFSIVANGATVSSNLDIFAVVGCKSPYVIATTVKANALGKIDLTFSPNRQNPFVSFIDIKRAI
jgi:Malectin domain